MENESIMNLSFSLTQSSYENTLRFLTFHWVRSWGPIPSWHVAKPSLDTSLQSGNHDTDLCLKIHKSELCLLNLRKKLHIDCNRFIAFTN